VVNPSYDTPNMPTLPLFGTCCTSQSMLSYASVVSFVAVESARSTLRGQLEDALGLEPSPEVLDDEDVSVLRQFFDARRHLCERSVGDPVTACAETRSAAARPCRWASGSRLQVGAVAHRDHHFLQGEGGLGRGLLRLGGGGEEERGGRCSGRDACYLRSPGVRRASQSRLNQQETRRRFSIVSSPTKAPRLVTGSV